MPGPVGSARALLGPAAMPLPPFITGAGCHFKMDGPAPTHQAEGQSSPLGVPITVASEGGGMERKPMWFSWVEDGQGSEGPRPQEGVVPTRSCLSRAAPGTWCGCGCESTLAGQASLVDICLAISPFSCERQERHNMGAGGCHLPWEGIVLRDTCPRTGVAGLVGAECQGEEGNQQKVLSGGWALKGRAVLRFCHHLWPCPQSRSDGPPPCQDHAAAVQRAPSPPPLAAT